MSETGNGDATTRRLCDLAGVATEWSDIFGKRHEVATEDLHRVLAALDLGGDNPAERAERVAMLEDEQRHAPPLLTAEAGATVFVPGLSGRWRIGLESGGGAEGESDAAPGGGRLRAPTTPGYHRLEAGDLDITLAVAPERCFRLADALHREAPRAWGLALQLYSLRRPGDGGVGDFEALAAFAREAAEAGAQALAISPVHAQFSADPERFSPYAPSSRVMLNALHVAAPAPGPEAARLEALELVEWPAVARDRLGRLRTEFEAGAADAAAFRGWRRKAGTALEGHALFEALHAHLWGRDQSLWHWRDWPAAYASREASGIAAFERDHAREIAFHAWLQYRADLGLADAQRAARDAGMAVGLISDLAVGADSGGSLCWSHQGESLHDLTIGAPPDLLQANGQNWGITGFSARGLRQNGFSGFIEMLRGAMRHAGGVRIDHAMGINRLWIIPDGETAKHGTYLRFPEDDLRRLIKLESVRQRAIVLAEDLGTVPDGFQERLQQAGICGMRVLMFERDDDGFVSPQRWTEGAAAMTSTHDLPPVAGWWAGRDIAERARIFATPPETMATEQATRERDRQALWQAMRDSDSAEGVAPAPGDTGPVAAAAIAHAARSACELLMVPVEDALGLTEQPNLPGTTDQHPNWRRRLSQPAGRVLGDAATRDRLAPLLRIRGTD